MFEWQVNEDEEVFAEPLGEWQPRPSRVNWRLLLAVVLGCVAVAAGVLRWRVAERERVMREDLTRFVTLEERSRLFGLRENVASLLVSNAPEEWAERYLDTFVEPDEARPVEMEVGRIEFRGENALATVLLDEAPQARRYRLTSQGWRRAPIRREDWSMRDPLELRVGDDITLSFTPRDEAFARALMDDLPALTEEMAEWSAARSNARLPERIQIQSVEFREPLMRSDEESVVLNSPLLVPPSSLSGEAAVRLALAHDLFGRAHAVEPQEGGLPGRGRFISAAHAVAAMRWALPPDEQARLRDAWRSRLGGEWEPPFFSGVRTGLRIDVVEPNRAEATALLAADYLYEKHGPEVLGDIAREAATADSWDAILLGKLRQYTAHLNTEIEAYARGGLEAANRVEEVAPAVTPVALPLDTGRVEPLPSGQSRFQVQVPGAREPILVHASGAAISDPQGNLLPPSCISLYGDIRIYGDWIDVGRELQATRIETRGEIVPPLEADWTPAPPETIGYFITHQQGSIEAPPSQVIAALQPDGTMVPLGRFTDSGGLISAVQRGETLQFVVSQQQVTCNHRSFGLYEPVPGLVSYWSTQPGVGGGFGGVLSRPDSPDLLTYTFDDGTTYSLLETEGSNRLTRLGRAEGFEHPLAWRPGTGEVLTINAEQSVFRFVDPATGALQRSVEVKGFPYWGLQLSVDGRYLSYLSAPGLRESDGQPDFQNATLHIYDLVEETEETLAFAGEQLFFWPRGVQSNTLPVSVRAVGDEAENGLLGGRRLLIVDPADPQNYVVADEVSGDEFIVFALNCASGTILYFVMNEEGRDFEVRFWPSNGRPPIPVEASDSSFPLACP